MDDAEKATNIPYAISTRVTTAGHSLIVAKFVRSYVQMSLDRIKGSKKPMLYKNFSR